MGHFKKVCLTCKKVITQCRCMDCIKQIQYDVCDACKGKKSLEYDNGPIRIGDCLLLLDKGECNILYDFIIENAADATEEQREFLGKLVYTLEDFV